jgi:hypothetical protein
MPSLLLLLLSLALLMLVAMMLLVKALQYVRAFGGVSEAEGRDALRSWCPQDNDPGDAAG